MTNIKQYPLIKSILARKFLFYILLFSSIITLIGTSIQLYLEYNKDKTQIQNTLDQIETAHLQSIVNNLWLSDQELINVQLQEMLSLPDIKHIAIYSDGEEKISVGSRKSTTIISREYPLTYAFRNQEVNLGSLRIDGSLDNALQRLRSRVYVILLTQGIKTFLVSLFIFFVFYFLIGRHLRTIADFARRIDLQTIDTSTRLELLPERGQPDELDQVASALNDMQGRLCANTTERKQAEEAQQTSEENYRLLFTELNSGFGLNEVICDEAGLPCNYRFLAVNHAFEKMMGMPAEQIVGKTVLEIMPAMPRSRIERYGSIALTGISEEFEEYSPLIGKQLEISVYSPKRGQFAVIFHDITKRKQAEVALRDNEEKYRHLYETMTQGVILQDSEGKVIEANVSACEILGLSMDQLFEKTAYDPRWKLIHEDGSPYDPSEMPSNIALLTGKPVENVFCGIYVPEKGEHRWIMIGSSPKFREGETQPYMTMIVFSNIARR